MELDSFLQQVLRNVLDVWKKIRMKWNTITTRVVVDIHTIKFILVKYLLEPIDSNIEKFCLEKLDFKVK